MFPVRNMLGGLPVIDGRQTVSQKGNDNGRMGDERAVSKRLRPLAMLLLRRMFQKLSEKSRAGRINDVPSPVLNKRIRLDGDIKNFIQI